MAKPAEHILTPTRRRVLVVSEDAWLRFRLQREIEGAGCDVTLLAKLRPAEPAQPSSYDIVLTDAALFPESSRLEALRALREASPQARFVLLVGPGESRLAEQARQSGFAQVLDRPSSAVALPALVSDILGRGSAPAMPVTMDFHFMLEKPKGAGKRGARTSLISLVVHSVILMIIVVLPLAFTESLDVQELASTWLAAPPPPRPPPAPQALQARRLRPVTQIQQGKLVAPKAIPKEVKIVVDKDMDVRDVGGIVGGVPGGVAGGQLGGVLGGVLSKNIPKPPPAPEPTAPVRVGGHVRPPRLVRRVDPVYPIIAKQARIQGMVRIDAIIDKTGGVIEMKVLSGHPLLAQAALDAVSRWVYEPTYLNERPIDVVLEVTVNFGLQGRR